MKQEIKETLQTAVVLALLALVTFFAMAVFAVSARATMSHDRQLEHEAMIDRHNVPDRDEIDIDFSGETDEEFIKYGEEIKELAWSNMKKCEDSVIGKYQFTNAPSKLIARELEKCAGVE